MTQERDNKRKLVFDNNDCFVGRFNLETNEYDGEVPFRDDFKLMSFSGLHIIKPEYFSGFELNPCYVFDLYKDIAKKAAVKSKPIESDYWFDLGTQKQLEEASTMLLSRQSFISKISNYITDNYNLTKDLLTIIFPNKRAALELRKELEKIKKNKKKQRDDETKAIEKIRTEQRMEEYTFKGKDLKSVTDSFIQKMYSLSSATGFDMKA